MTENEVRDKYYAYWEQQKVGLEIMYELGLYIYYIIYAGQSNGYFYWKPVCLYNKSQTCYVKMLIDHAQLLRKIAQFDYKML